MVTHQRIGILGGGVGRGVHAHKARPGAAQQPAIGRNQLRLPGNVTGNLGAHAAIVHQRRDAELPAGVADGGSGLHIAAGVRRVGTDAAHHDVVGEIAVHRHLQHHTVTPVLIGLAGAIQYAGDRGIHRLHGTGVHDQLIASVGALSVLPVSAAVVGAAIQGVFISAPAAGEIHDVIEELLAQGEIPSVHLTVDDAVALLIGEPGALGGFRLRHGLLRNAFFGSHFLGVDVQRQSTDQQHPAQKQGQSFLEYRLSHRVQLLSHTGALPALVSTLYIFF